MKLTPVYLLIILMLTAFRSEAQSTMEMVHDLMTSKCGSTYCHGDPGTSSGFYLRPIADSLRADLVWQLPANTAAAAKGQPLVLPGDPYRSFLFRKINDGLDKNTHLDTDEGLTMPVAGSLTNEEKELIRQWIIEGAPPSSKGMVVDTSLIRRYYDHPGNRSVETPPAAPAPGEGFQIHMGPFFVEESGEEEYYSKYYLMNPDSFEVTRLQNEMGIYSHHFIIYEITDPGVAASIDDGLRDDPEHSAIDIVEAIQYSADIELPERTALFWAGDGILDLNSHYINYNPDSVLAADVYVNVYTQPIGMAVHEMKSALLYNPFIYIPADGLYHSADLASFDASVGEVFIWAITSHTHKYGTDYDVYIRNTDGSAGDHIFEASCAGGIPGCPTQIYDYRHPPTRYWDDFLPVDYTTGLLSRASYLNYGSVDVSWGSTSEDEMMITLVMYIEDTVGLTSGIKPPTTQVPEQIRVWPNPSAGAYFVSASDPSIASLDYQVIDVNGRLLQSGKIEGFQGKMELQTDLAGVYMVRFSHQGEFIGSVNLLKF